ncbi:MAG: hypothetical protein ABI779_20730 [Acidobacteriota bacterium]
MKRKSVAVLALLLALAGGAQALETRDLVAMAAMPLAVAAVSQLTDVPTADLMSLVSTLNLAAVPAPQFVEVVRYAPIALVDTTQPPLIEYVNTEYRSGVVGEPLALAIADRYPTYGVQEIDFNHPSTFTVVDHQEQILPPVVITRFQTVEYDPVSLVAMPLAVAAVADLADVPRSDLISMIMALNQGRVAAPQFIEVVRYAPVVLIDRDASPRFLAYVNTQVDRGLVGRPLAFAIGDRLRQSGINEINVVSPPRLYIVDRPDLVILPRIVETRTHPHGGPPGQLKKELGLQTGAEVVHGTRPSQTARTRKVVVHTKPAKQQRVVHQSPARPAKVAKPRAAKQVAAPKPQKQQKVKIQKNPHFSQAPAMRQQQAAPHGGNPGGGKGNGKGKKG